MYSQEVAAKLSLTKSFWLRCVLWDYSDRRSVPDCVRKMRPMISTFLDPSRLSTASGGQASAGGLQRSGCLSFLCIGIGF